MRESLSLAQEGRGTLRAPGMWSAGIPEDLMAARERGYPPHILYLPQVGGFSKPNLRCLEQPGWEGWWAPAVTLSPPAGHSACRSEQVYPSASSQLNPSMNFPVQPSFPDPLCAFPSQPQVRWVSCPICYLIPDPTIVTPCAQESHPGGSRSTLAPWQEPVTVSPAHRS